MIKLIELKDSTNAKFIGIENDTISNTISKYGSWEGHLVNLYYNLIKENNIVIDIGANIGYHSVHFGNIVGSSGRVFSFEPQKLIYDILSTNILKNGLSNIITQYNIGLSSKKQTMYLSNIKDMTYDNGMVNFGGVQLNDEITGGSIINVQTLDNIFTGNVDFIKIDIEGMESEVIKGATKTIKNSLPIIFIEISKNHDEIYSFFKENEYEIYRIINHGNGNDYICLHQINHKDIINQMDIIFKKYNNEYQIL
jgi:FkbM family methyltransferase